MTTGTVRTTSTSPLGRVRHWTAWAPYLAAAWSLGYALLGLYWWFGGAGYPFARVTEDRSTSSILEGMPASHLAPFLVALGILGTVAALVMARSRSTGIRRGPVLALGWVLAGALTVVIPDYTPLATLAFSPLIVVFAFTGIPGPQGGVGDILYWHRGNLLLMFVGGLVWAAATLAYQRRTREACAHCGRAPGADARWWPQAALRWGRRAVWVAVLAPLPYEITRLAWFFGVPLGITPPFLAMMAGTPYMLGVGFGCAMASVAGGILTHGLVHRWGEVFPRWLPVVGGRRVPPMLAVAPASLVALVLPSAGLMNLTIGFVPGDIATTGPGVLLLLWGPALGVATYAYHLRRRGSCRVCGRGDAGVTLVR